MANPLSSRSSSTGVRRRRAPTSLRTRLLRIVLVSLGPLLLFGVVTVVLFAREEREIIRSGSQDRTLALLTAIDTELKRSVAALESLATAEHLDRGDLDAFRRDAQRVLASRPEWLNIHLAPPSGRQVVNLLRPPGASFHSVVDEGTFSKVVAEGQPEVGNLFVERFTGKLVFPVRVPVVRESVLRYVLTALVRPEAIQALLTSQELPAGWVGVVLDDSERIVARTIDASLVGKPASESLRAELARASSGWFYGSTVEGWPVYSPFHRSSFSGWSVAMGIPVAAVEASLLRSLALLAILGVALLGSGIALAWVLSRGTARSLEELAAMAEQLGMGRSVATAEGFERASGIAEVEELRTAFVRAEELIRARSEERDRVEASLRAAEAELRESEQRKDQFLAMLGHELRNPLGVVSTAIELLREVSPDEASTAEPRAMIERQVSHMTKLLDDLLDVARIAEGRIQVSRKVCDLVAIVRETVDDYRGAVERGGLKLDLDLPQQPLWVMGDPLRLAQALGNLLQNALKYTDAGGRIDVTLREDEGGAGATLSVRDTGVGMEAEILAHAFEPFSQADRTIARSRGGLGLGLALVRGLVELHGGSVSAASEGSGRGTTVVVRLPLEPPLQAPLERGEAAHGAPASRPLRILVVEDNEMAARSMQLYLTRMGHAVEVTHSGLDGIAAVDAFAPDVVLCDIGLPGADGYTVARSVRERRGERPFLIAVSGYGQDADRRRAREAGFDEHLTKPVDLDELSRLLARA